MFTNLDRRDFLKIAGMAGLGAVLPPFSRAYAETGFYEGPYFVSIHAGGAWDPAFFCDPKNDSALNRVTLSQGSAGNIRYAAMPVSAEAVGLPTNQGIDNHLMTNETFFARHGHRITVINGIDTSTNNHETGERFTWSGHLNEDYPCISAMVAATRGPLTPMSFISSGGYDVTDGLVPMTRVANPLAMGRVSEPNLADPSASSSQSYHSHGTFNRIRRAQEERLEALRAKPNLPPAERALGDLVISRATSADLDRLVLPSDLVTLPASLGNLQTMMRQTQLAMSAFEAGLAVSANLVLPGFDTHANHDRQQRRLIAELLTGIDFVIAQATQRNLLNKLVIVVGSDFGRGPHYNGAGEAGGKDHWPITSMMVMGPGIEGNRVIGATDATQRPIGVDRNTFQPAASGVRLTPAVIQKALRRKLGIDAGEPSRKYALSGDDLALFG